MSQQSNPSFLHKTSFLERCKAQRVQQRFMVDYKWKYPVHFVFLWIDLSVLLLVLILETSLRLSLIPSDIHMVSIDVDHLFDIHLNSTTI